MNKIGKTSLRWTLFVIILSVNISGLYGLFCYNCLSLECPENQDDCESLRTFVISKLRTQYHLDKYLPPCPRLNESVKWRIFQVDSPRCPVVDDKNTACSVGRLQVLTQIPAIEKPLVFYGTILGCAQKQLIRATKEFFDRNHKCHIQTMNQTQSSLTYSLNLETCWIGTDLCSNDFCVDHRDSIIKPYKTDEKKYNFEFGLIFSIVAIAIILIAALVGAAFCRSPVNRASNLPKASRTVAPESTTQTPGFGGDNKNLNKVLPTLPSTSGNSAASQSAVSKLLAKRPTESSL